MTKVRGQTEAKAQENQQITSESLTRTRSQTQRSITLCSHRTEVAPPENLKKKVDMRLKWAKMCKQWLKGD